MKNNIEKEINSILLKNRNILRKNYCEEKYNIHKMNLIEEGFVFSYHTHQLTQQDGKGVFDFSYDFGITKFKDDYCEIISAFDLVNCIRPKDVLNKQLSQISVKEDANHRQENCN